MIPKSGTSETHSGAPAQPDRIAARRRSMAAVGVIASCALVLSACSSDRSDTATQTAVPDVLHFALGEVPSGFDPVLAQGVQAINVGRLLYDGLTRRDLDGTLVGGIATSWTQDSATEYTFTIRDDATCSDGTAITPSIVASSLTYFASPATGGPTRSLVFGTGDVTVTADDAASTVKISLAQVFTPLLSGLATPAAGIICPAGLADLPGLKAGTVAGAYSGPYALGAIVPGTSYDYDLRTAYVWPEYAGGYEGTPPKTIRMEIVTDQSTISNQLISDDLDLIQLTDSGPIARLSGYDDVTVYDVKAFSAFIIFNERAGHVFADAAAREAVAAAVNQEGFNAVFSDGKAELLKSVVPSSYECVNTDDDLLTPYDPKAAAAVLKGLKIVMPATNYSPQMIDSATYIAKSLTDAGADAQIQAVDTATLYTILSTPDANWDIAMVQLANPVGSLSATLPRVSGPSFESGGRNYTGSNNVAGTEQLQIALSSTDESKRCDAYQEAQKILLERVDVVPLAVGSLTYVSGNDVTVQVVGDYLDFSTIRFKN